MIGTRVFVKMCRRRYETVAVKTLAAILPLLVFGLRPLGAETTLSADRCGIRPGGADSGPAVAQAVERLAAGAGPATLLFSPDATYRLRTAPAGPWVFELAGMKDITVDGRGSTFLLGPGISFARIMRSANVRLRNCTIDYDPLPFAEATVTGKNAKGRYIDADIIEGFALPPPGGPTRTGGEQAYFGMLWNRAAWKRGPCTLVSKHYWIADTAHLGDRSVRVYAADRFRAKEFAFVEPGRTRVTLPVRGIAHRGACAVIEITDSTDVHVQNVAIRSAPWFACGVSKNRGTVTFRNVTVRPKPGTKRITSAWRDGFHVCGNYARLLWEDCCVKGTNDDDFNIKTFFSRVTAVRSPTVIRIRQNFPLTIIPYHPGDTIAAYDGPGGNILGRSTVTRCDGTAETDRSDGRPRSPVLTLTLEEPITGLRKRTLVWNASSANPDTTLRRCAVHKSCRFQCSLAIEDCRMLCFTWFYGHPVEGPIPRDIVIRNSVLGTGRGGNPDRRVSVAVAGPIVRGPGGKRFPVTAPVIETLVMEGNTVYGDLSIANTGSVLLRNNRFPVPERKIILENSRHIILENNRRGEKAVADPADLIIRDDATRRAVLFR